MFTSLLVSHVTCQFSCVTCRVLHVMCNMSHVTIIFIFTKWWSSLVEALLSTGPIPFSLIWSVNLFLQIFKTPSLLGWAGQLLENITPHHLSNVNCPVSQVTCHVSHTCFFSFGFFSLWMVCYQRGQPHLVFLFY